MQLLNTIRLVVMAAAIVFPISFANSNQDKTNIQFSQKDLYCLTKNIYHEARGEPYLGKIAVAQVTLNRVNHPTLWASTICGVVYEQIRGVAQFSWTTDHTTKIMDHKAWYEAKQIAYGILSGELIIKNFNYTHFHNLSINFAQKLKNSSVIGNHVFYHN